MGLGAANFKQTSKKETKVLKQVCQGIPSDNQWSQRGETSDLEYRDSLENTIVIKHILRAEFILKIGKWLWNNFFQEFQHLEV